DDVSFSQPPPPTPIYTLSLHDALPISYPLPEAQLDRFMFNVVISYLPEDEEVTVVAQTTARKPEPILPLFTGDDVLRFHDMVRRSEEHTSELQSRENLVCRLLLEKQNQ